MEYHRQLQLPSLLKQKSFFLFGPRSTGKSYLIHKQLTEDCFIINLLQSHWMLKLSQTPDLLESVIKAQDKKWIVIDEIQKIPEILSEVHYLIEKYQYHFLLTGSSARKLKQNQANLLAGRAWVARLFPLVYPEIPNFKLDYYLRWGGLPQVYPSKNPLEELDAYVQTYLKEEILSEGLIRKLPPFARFLKTAALSNGQILNMSQIASDASIPASTVREYYAILEDTLLGYYLEPWLESKKRKAVQTAKFYFFDLGVLHHLIQTEHLDRNSNLYGQCFEHWIGLEIRAYLNYRRIKKEMSFWRSREGLEVDFLVGNDIAVEVKSSTKVNEKFLKGLKALKEEAVFKQFFLVSQDKINYEKEGILVMYYQDFIEQLWAGKII